MDTLCSKWEGDSWIHDLDFRSEFKTSIIDLEWYLNPFAR